jgi:prepilin-type N-terminal cleavage/methylation domain-containing protein
VVEPGARESGLCSWSREDGITLIELMLALAIFTIVAYVVTPAFLQTIRISGYTSDALVNQQRMTVITTMLTNDLRKADMVVPDPGGASDRLDFAVSEVIIEGGSLVYVSSYYRYLLQGQSIVKRPVSYDEEAKVVIDSGADPVWRYDGEISDLSFECKLSPADGTVIMVTATITVGSGRGTYTKTIKVTPRNAV